LHHFLNRLLLRLLQVLDPLTSHQQPLAPSRIFIAAQFMSAAAIIAAVMAAAAAAATAWNTLLLMQQLQVPAAATATTCIDTFGMGFTAVFVHHRL
jgi:hypothetical protein